MKFIRLPGVVLALAPVMGLAGPTVSSDPYPAADNPKPTQCGVYVDSAPKITIPITVDSQGTRCVWDAGPANLAVGAHAIKMSHLWPDPLYGAQESAVSSPLALTRLGPPKAPTGLSASP